MTGKIRAAVKTGIEETRIREFDWPQIGSDTALLRVESAGVGGSDPELYRKPDYAPVIMGHENVGTIAEIGEAAVQRWGVNVGDRVALQEFLPCWHCKWCLQGDFRLCVEADFFNVKDRFNTLRFGTCSNLIPPHLHGGFAEFLFMPANSVVHKVPENVPARHATLAVPFGNGVTWACSDGGAGPGKTVLVFGPGQQGLGCVLAAKCAGSHAVILVGRTRDRSRLDLSLRLGADFAVDSELEDLEARVRDITGGEGVDVVVDTTGDPDGDIVNAAIELAAKGAWLNLNGLNQQVPIRQIKKKYLTVRAPRGRRYADVEQALRVIASGRWPIDEVCSHDFGLADVDLAIKATAGREIDDAIHVTVDPWK